MRKLHGFLALAALVGASAAGNAGAVSSARIDCTVQENGAAASGSFRVRRDDAEIAKGSCGRPVEVPEGRYDVAVILDGAADAPERHQSVDAKAGQLAKVQASFETGEILVEVSREGRRAMGTVQLMQSGRAVATLTAGVASHVSVGTYSLEVESRGSRRTFDAVTVARGERRTISADFAASAAQASP